ncbi:hypothetical protein V2I01_00915 [Micromonospora sp. BRA006-A]|nr:hypothetical protein [Micromonospora sp. BRA006-A]
MADLVILAGGEDIVSRATPVAVGVIVRLVLAAGLGLIAVIASVVVSITTARALVRQLERLREAAFKLAHERLPSVVDRLGREEVDVAREAPPCSSATTRSVRWARRSTSCRRPPSAPPSSRPSCAAASATCS